MYRLRRQPTPTVFELNSVSAWTSRNPWNPSPIHRLPWFGLSALLGVLAGTASAIAILVTSNGNPVSEWSIQPAVYLAISSTVTNIMLNLSFVEGVNVAWWRRAMKENTKIADLHRHWSFGHSFWAAFTAGKQFNLVALASILAAVAPVNGPLLQQASYIHIGDFLQPSNMGIMIAQSLPYGYTGYLDVQERPASLTAAFIQTAQAFDNQSAINVNSTGCKGECTATVSAAGFTVNCSTSTTPFSLTRTDPRNGRFSNTSQEAMINATIAFGSYLLWEASEPGTMQLGVQFKDQQTCNGQLQIRNCTLQAAVVGYPVIVSGNKGTIELAPGSSMFDDVTHSAMKVASNTAMGPTTFGGLYKALSDTYDSEAIVGANGYELLTTGATSNRYAVLNMGSPFPYANCTVSFRDPSNDILAAVRDLTFRTAIAAADSTDTQHVTAQETTTLPFYVTQYLYLLPAVLFTTLAWLAVTPMLFDCGYVGRRVSMSPVETAKAFGAAQLRNSDSNADVDKLIQEVGDRPVQYGATTVSGVEYRLELNEPKYMRVPRAGERFAG